MKIIILLSCLNLSLFAHSGRTNKSGCHNNRKTGGYHCHYSGQKKKAVQPKFLKDSKPKEVIKKHPLK